MNVAANCMVRLVFVLLASLALAGCSDSGKKAKKVRTIQGVARKIDLKNNSVSMTFMDREGKDRLLEGSVKEDTDVLINGRAAKLEDLREGDKVSVSGYKDGSGDDTKFVATRVEVTRSADSDWKSTSSGKNTTSAPAAGH